jgi:hypothetical protein
MGRHILIMASLITGFSIVHASPVEMDWMVDRFFNDATGSLSGIFGIYQAAVLPVFPTSIDINYLTVTTPEPATLLLPIIGLMGIGIFRRVFKIQGLSSSGVLVKETGFDVSADFTVRCPRGSETRGRYP